MALERFVYLNRNLDSMVAHTYIHTDIHIHIYVLKYRECLTIQFEWKEDCRLLNEEIGKWKRAYEVRLTNICMHAYIHTYIHIPNSL